MSHTCGYCKGSGGRTKYYKSYGEQKEEWVPCKVCGGSGYDPNWRETQCKILSCRAIIEYDVRWTRIPEYCEECRKPQYKRCPNCNGWIEYRVWWDKIPEYCKECYTPKYKECKNPDCRHQFKYYDFWDNIPDYCQDCKGWRERPCKNPDCNGKVIYHNDWTNIPDYCDKCKGFREKPCKNPDCHGQVRFHNDRPNTYDYCYDCKGWRFKDCGNTRCSNKVRYHNEWNNPPKFCEDCTEMSKRRGINEICIGTNLERFLERLIHYNIIDRGDHYHVTISFNGGHISGDIDKFSTKSRGIHVTFYNYDESGEVKGPGRDDWVEQLDFTDEF